jgi:hypothetical protein
MESILTRMELYMKASGSMISNTESELRSGLMEHNTKETLLKARSKVMEF